MEDFYDYCRDEIATIGAKIESFLVDYHLWIGLVSLGLKKYFDLDKLETIILTFVLITTFCY